MKRIIFATSNEGKMKEIRLIMEDSGYEVVSLKEAGISAERIVLEDQSVNTAQNLKFSFALLRNPEDRMGLVSNSFHVFRAVHIARAQGREVAGIPAKTDWWMLPHYMTREAFALVKDFLVGNAGWKIR